MSKKNMVHLGANRTEAHHAAFIYVALVDRKKSSAVRSFLLLLLLGKY